MCIYILLSVCIYIFVFLNNYYVGVCFCFAEIDNCDSQPCFNGGKCLNAVNSYKCACAKGYLGDACQIGINN